jgi:hypothetical protein
VHVAGPERLLLSARDRLLAERLHVERDLALSVRSKQPGIEAAHEHHVPKTGELVGDGEVGRPFPDRRAVVVEHTQKLFAHQSDALDLLVERRLPHLARLADEVHTVGRLVTSGRFRDPEPQAGRSVGSARSRMSGCGHSSRMSRQDVDHDSGLVMRCGVVR